MSNILHASKFNFVCLDKWIYYSTFLMQIESTNQSWRKKLRNLSMEQSWSDRYDKKACVREATRNNLAKLRRYNVQECFGSKKFQPKILLLVFSLKIGPFYENYFWLFKKDKLLVFWRIASALMHTPVFLFVFLSLSFLSLSFFFFVLPGVTKLIWAKLNWQGSKLSCQEQGWS